MGVDYVKSRRQYNKYINMLKDKKSRLSILESLQNIYNNELAPDSFLELLEKMLEYYDCREVIKLEFDTFLSSFICCSHDIYCFV